jgi:hypothetical protein
MKEIFGTGRTPARDTDQPSPMRRTLLKACAYLPTAPLLAMLGGCDDSSSALIGDTSTFTPGQEQTIEAEITRRLNLRIPPFSTTDPVKLPENKLDTLTTGSVDVTHVPDKAPAPSKPKKVGIYSLQYNSFTQVSTRKLVPLGTPGSVKMANPDYKPPIVEPNVPVVSDNITSLQSIFPIAPDAPVVQDISVIVPDATVGQNTSPPVKQEPVPAPEYIAYENIETYLKRALDNRFALLYRAMVMAFDKHPMTKFDVSFVTAPEFYWNVPFGDYLNEAELQVAANLCLDTVTRNVRILISKFPMEKYGPIVLLPGTTAMLKPNPDARRADGALLGADGTIVYNASNHLVCTHNLPLNDKKYPRPAYMIWPKRAVSHIDFIDEANVGGCNVVNQIAPNPLDPEITSYLHQCIISKKNGVTVLVESVSSSLVQSFDSNGNLYSKKFQNDIIDGLPFGIDICLDYGVASVQKDEYRIAQLDKREFKLNFQIAAGMGLDLGNYADTPYIQYAIYNEGYSGDTGETAVWKLHWTKGQGQSLGTMTKEDLSPLDAIFDDNYEHRALPVDQSQDFAAPKGFDMTGIPNILDEMNPGIVKVWSLDVDKPADAVVASNPSTTTMVADKTIQFIK